MPLTPLPALAYWRIQRLLSQPALAARVGVRIRTIRNLEHGSGARLEIIRRLAAALDVTPDDLRRQPPRFEDGSATPPAP